MGIFGSRGRGRRREEYNELLNNQREQSRLNEIFRNETKKNIERIEEENEKLRDDIRNLKKEVRLIKRDKTKSEKEREEEIEIINKQREKKEEEIKIKEDEEKLSEKELKEAKIFIEKAISQLKEAIVNKNFVVLEKLENKLKENILIFKKEYIENPKTKKLKQVSEMIYIMAEYYYANKEYDKSLYYYLECENFNLEKKNLTYRIITSLFNLGKYDEIEKYLENYTEDENKVEEWLLKAKIYLKIENKEEAEKYLIKLNKKNLTDIVDNKIEKWNIKKYLKILEDFIVKYKIKDNDILDRLFFGLMYIKDFTQINDLLNNFKDYSKKEYFLGLLTLKESKLDMAKDKISKFYGSFFADIYSSKFEIDNLDKNDIQAMDRVIQLKYDEENLLPYLISRSQFFNKKYDILEIKLRYIFKTNRRELDNFILDLKNILKEEKVQVGEDKGNNSFWKSYKEILDYLKQTNDSKYNEFYDIFIKNTTEKTREFIEKLKDEIKVNIDEEYEILEKRSSLSMYNEFLCKNKFNKEVSNYIEIFETLGKDSVLKKETALSEEKILALRDSHFLRIENFNIGDNKIKIITENYDKLYSQIKTEISLLSLKEKIEESLALICAFEGLEKEKIYINKLSEDNLVKVGESYKFRFLKYMNSSENLSLTSTNSTYKKKQEMYKTPDKQENIKSNIYILGELLYDIFYEYHILDAILDKSCLEINENSLIKRNEIKEKFHSGEFIDIAYLNHIPRERLYMINENRAKIKKINKEIYVPSEIIELLEKLLSSETIDRPNLDTIYNEFDNIKENLNNFKDYFPKIIKEDDLSLLIEKKAKDIKNIYTREKNINLSEAKYSEKLYSSIILKMNNDDEYHFNRLKDGKYDIFKKEKEKIDYEVKSEELLERIRKILENDSYKKFAKINKINLEDAEIFFYSAKVILEKRKKTGLYEITNSDKELFKNLSTLSELDVDNLSNEEEFIKILLRIIIKED